ncbi:thiamine phosphate synthase [Natronoarchaeum rubrum]|uniref:thiamine phosphate synthase n=1 Tax=Natronoarchaeum rubrum TaxID=755311 RepID=UPI002112FEA1|nr:thiamine phosphate synthase [Natronoarchaeum rubrum]
MPPQDWRTYLVTQESLSAGRSTVEIARAAIEGGVDAIQLRDKNRSALRRYETGQRLRELTAETGVDLIVNDRVDLAQSIDADGVHLGQSDLPVPVARDLLGEDAVIGKSTSFVEEARAAEREGADYLGVGAVYGTSSKNVPDDEADFGPERVREIVDAVEIPVVGIGGIDAANAAAVAAAGADGVAVISAITSAEDPAAATRELREAVERGRER